MYMSKRASDKCVLYLCSCGGKGFNFRSFGRSLRARCECVCGGTYARATSTSSSSLRSRYVYLSDLPVRLSVRDFAMLYVYTAGRVDGRYAAADKIDEFIFACSLGGEEGAIYCCFFVDGFVMWRRWIRLIGGIFFKC